MRAKKQPTCKNSGKKKQEGCKIAVKSPFEKNRSLRLRPMDDTSPPADPILPAGCRARVNCRSQRQV